MVVESLALLDVPVDMLQCSTLRPQRLQVHAALGRLVRGYIVASVSYQLSGKFPLLILTLEFLHARFLSLPIIF